MLLKAFDALRLSTLSLVALSAAFALPAQAQDKKDITLNAFRSSSLWPIWAAQKQGYFGKHGLTIKMVYTQNSTSQMIGLIKGEFDMANTALDNVIAYSEGEGSPDAPKEADLAAFIGGNNGTLTLIAQPEIKSVKDLAGKDLAVDSPSTGFSFVLREMLAQNGLKDGDYKLVRVRQYRRALEGAARQAGGGRPADPAGVADRGGAGLQQYRHGRRRARRLSGHRHRGAPRLDEDECQ